MAIEEGDVDVAAFMHILKVDDVGFVEEIGIEDDRTGLDSNQVPHIHWHVIPRLKSDPGPLKPVWCIAHEPV